MIELLAVEPTEDVNLSDMTKSELLEFARKNGIEGANSSMLKADIYNTIVEALNG